MANVNLSLFQASRGKRIREGIARAFLGLLVLAVGVGYLGNHLDFCPWNHFTLFFPGWGALFLIVPAVYFFIRRPTSIFWPLVFLVGALILLANQDGYGIGQAAAIVLAVAIIFVGLRIILAPLFRRAKRHKKAKTHREKGENHYSQSFGERTVILGEQSFNNATLSCSFGQLNFDLRCALIEDPAVIDARCSCGEIHILLPAGVKVELNRSVVLGEVNNRYANSKEPATPTIYINAECSFGEIVIQ